MLNFILLHFCVSYNTSNIMDDQNETSQKKKMRHLTTCETKHMPHTIVCQIQLLCKWHS